MVDLEKFKDIHKGGRCFLMGTGPSLNDTNLDLIKDEIIFGVNTLYKLNLPCKYYGVSDVKVWQVHKEHILHLNTTLFLSGYAAMNFATNPEPKGTFKQEPIIIPEVSPHGFSKDITNGLCNGQTVIYDIGLQVAYYMGFEKVYLLGVDADYSGAHHFDGAKAENMSGGAVGNWSRVFAAHKLAKQIFEEDGREILNATPGGKLEIYRRVKLEDVV